MEKQITPLYQKDREFCNGNDINRNGDSNISILQSMFIYGIVNGGMRDKCSKTKWRKMLS